MSVHHPTLTALSRVAIPAVLLASAACGPANRERTAGAAKDEWVRSYPLAEGGEVSFINDNGGIEIEGVSGLTAVDVRIERTVKAPSESAARDLLPKIAFEEKTAPDRVLVRTEGVAGVLIGVSFETHYHVKVPAGARVSAETRNGPITISSLSGRLTSSSRNGNVTGNALRGPIDIRTGGNATLDMEALGDETAPVVVRLAQRGTIDLALPETAKATLSASTGPFGRVNITGLPFEPIGEEDAAARQRRLRGRINGGGAPVELSTMAGSIEIHPRTKPAP